MKKIFSVFIFFLLLISLSTPFLSLAHAADIRSGNNINIPSDEKDLTDLYLFGNNIQVEAPVMNDLTAGGRDIVIDNNVSGSILAAGGTLRIRGNSGGTVRVVGGNIVIDGKVGRDLLVGGGNVIIAKTATIAGDLLIAGGELVIQGNVNGKTIINGGQVRIEGKLSKQVEGNMGRLHIGPKAVIGGNLTYSSSEKATIEKGGVIAGTQHYTRVEKPKEEGKQFGKLFGAFSIYKLVGDIILSIALIFFLGKFIKSLVGEIMNKPFKNFFWGFAFVMLTPLISLFLLIFLLPGAAAFLFYFLVLATAVYLIKIFTGWLLVRWWYKRSGKIYVLDWKSGVAGPIALFLLALIPVLGWLFIAILYLISIGAFIQKLAGVIKTQRGDIKTRK